MLFLDEPTSGLDSYAANLLVTNVSQIVKDRQLSCLMTVHQPSWAMFTQLDRVILLAKGRVYYDGPPRETIPWFKQLGYEVPEGVNPADHFISIAEGKAHDGNTVDHLLKSWGEKAGVVDTIQYDSGDVVAKEQYPTTAIKEFGILLVRWWREMVSARQTWLIQARDTQTIVATVGQTVIILILIGEYSPVPVDSRLWLFPPRQHPGRRASQDRRALLHPHQCVFQVCHQRTQLTPVSLHPSLPPFRSIEHS